MYVNVVFVTFVQCSEFNSGYRIVLYKNYELFTELSSLVQASRSLQNIAFFECRTHFSRIAASPYAKLQHRLNRLWLTGVRRITQH